MARILAPEEVRCGDFVSLLNEVIEIPSFFWCGDQVMSPPEEPIRWCRRVPDAGVPYRVVSVCLPFVCLRGPGKSVKMIDMKQVQLARLSRSYGKRVWKLLQEQSPAL
ncbi:MAG TPA: hypothetical protein VNQ76_13520 [Planctomicrobium sp.]|nr:hypothetical protein [Planctomicrobium sp.]